MSYNQSIVLAGLSTYDIVAPSTGAFFMEGKIQLPSIKDGGGQSAVIATITNATTVATIYTGIAGADGFFANFLATAGDTIHLALTSAADADQPLNALKTTVQFGSAQ